MARFSKTGKIAKGLVIFAAVALAALNLFAYFFLDRLMFPAPAPSYGRDAQGLVFLPDAGGEIAALWLPNPGAKKALLYCHGNGEDIGMARSILDQIHDAGFSVLAMDYPGYGLTPGKASETEAYRAAEAAFRFLVDDTGFAPGDIIVHGFSIGSGSACFLSEKHPVGGLVFQGGFTSAPRVVTRLRLLVQDPFPNIRRVKRINCPKLFIHGDRDPTVPYALGCQVFEAALGPKQFITVPGGGHTGLPGKMAPGTFVGAIAKLAGIETRQE